MDEATRKEVLFQWQERRRDQITHPFLGEKVEFGLVPFVQALLMARFLRGDLDCGIGHIRERIEMVANSRVGCGAERRAANWTGLSLSGAVPARIQRMDSLGVGKLRE